MLKCAQRFIGYVWVNCSKVMKTGRHELRGPLLGPALVFKGKGKGIN